MYLLKTALKNQFYSVISEVVSRKWYNFKTLAQRARVLRFLGVDLHLLITTSGCESVCKTL
jgi:hypothetical protein